MSLTSEQAQTVLTEIELIKHDNKNTKVLVDELHVQHKDTLGAVNNLSDKISNLVTIMEVKTVNDEHLNAEVEVNRVEIKEVDAKLSKFEEKAWPILRKAKDAQNFKGKIVDAMASSTGKIIITLLLAGVAYSAAVAFGLEIK